MFCTSEILKGNGLGYKLEYKDGECLKKAEKKNLIMGSWHQGTLFQQVQILQLCIWIIYFYCRLYY